LDGGAALTASPTPVSVRTTPRGRASRAAGPPLDPNFHRRRALVRADRRRKFGSAGRRRQEGLPSASHRARGAVRHASQPRADRAPPCAQAPVHGRSPLPTRPRTLATAGRRPQHRCMHNTFTAPQTTHAGIPHPTLQKALRCCLIRLSRRVYTVRRRCPVHEDFHAFIDDSSTLTLRSALGEQWTPADSVRLRRTEYAGVLGTYRHYDPDDVIGGTSAALIHGVPLLDARPPRRVATVHSGSARSAFDPRISCGEPGDSVRVEVWNPRRSHNSRWIVRRRAVLTADQT